MKKGDICLIIIAVIFLLLWFMPKEQGGVANVYIDGKLEREISLDKNTQFTVESKFGKNTVTVKDGNVYITHADCPDKLCQKGKIASSGESIVCLPNRLSIIIENSKKSKTDVIL